MIRFFFVWWIILTVVVFGQESQSIPAAPDGDLQALQRELEYEIMAPCCYGSPVADHDSEAARQVKREIAQLLTEGKTKQEILDIYVAEYGEQILARPRARGFNLLAYIMPPALLLGGGLLLGFFLNRIKLPTELQTPKESASYDDKLLRKIEKEMQELDI